MNNLVWMKFAVGIFCITCGAMMASAGTVILEATIDGAQTNAGAGTESVATGRAFMALNDASNELTWNLTWQDLTLPAVAAHFHGPALPNENAGVQVAISGLASPSTGAAVLSGEQAADLLAGLWYINIHTTTYPGGEIRGRVLVLPCNGKNKTLKLVGFGHGLSCD